MTHSRLCLAIMLAVFATGATVAEEGEKKLYRWVDKQGMVHYDDALPAEAVNQARDEFNAKTGLASGKVDRVLTPEERAQKAVADKLAAEAALHAEQQQRNEGAMLSTYQSEDDLRKSYDERIEVLKQTIESADVSLVNLHTTLTEILAGATEAELANRPVDAMRASAVRTLHAERIKEEAFRANRQTEMESLGAEFQIMLGRFRELRSDQNPAPPAESAATPAAVPPAAGAP